MKEPAIVADLPLKETLIYFVQLRETGTRKYIFSLLEIVNKAKMLLSIREWYKKSIHRIIYLQIWK